MALIKRIYSQKQARVKRLSFSEDIQLSYANKIDHKAKTLSGWDSKTMQKEIEEDDKILEQKINDFRNKNYSIMREINNINQDNSSRITTYHPTSVGHDYKKDGDVSRDDRMKNLQESLERELRIEEYKIQLNQIKEGDYSIEERYNLISDSFNKLVEGGVEIKCLVSPSELVEALDYFKDVAANHSDTQESSRLTQEIETVLEIISSKRKFTKYLCEASPDIIGRVYLQRLLS